MSVSTKGSSAFEASGLLNREGSSNNRSRTSKYPCTVLTAAACDVFSVLVGDGVAVAGLVDADGDVVSLGFGGVCVTATPEVQPASMLIARTQLARCLRR
jgi:hypothetical protein